MSSKWTIMAVTAALMVACGKPQLVAPPTTPLRVTVSFGEDRPDRGTLEHRWAEALRDRLANLGSVRPEGAPVDAMDSELKVEVKAVMARGDAVKRAALQTLDNTLSGSDLGLLVTVVAIPVAAVGTEGRALYHNARLGYKLRHFVCRVTYWKESAPGVVVLETTGWDVIKAMRPMSEAEAKIPGALQREEAEALATVVVERLEKDHHWQPVVRRRAREGGSDQP